MSNIQKIIIAVLVVMFCLNFVFSLLISLINPETYFFGSKIGGIKAVCWLLTNGVTGLIIAYSLFRSWRYDFLASLLFFGYNFANIMISITPALALPPLFSAGIILSFIGLIIKEGDHDGK